MGCPKVFVRLRALSSSLTDPGSFAATLCKTVRSQLDSPWYRTNGNERNPTIMRFGPLRIVAQMRRAHIGRHDLPVTA